MTQGTFRFDHYDLESITPQIASFGQSRFGYVVTPNADHMVRLTEDAGLRASYERASFVLLDSRFVAHGLRLLRGVKLPVCPGSDLTARLFNNVIKPEDRIVLIGGSEEQASQLRAQYGLSDLLHYNPPMGFIKDPVAVEETLQTIESLSPFRFCLLAVGAPQQEQLARMLHQRGKARGLAFCIGASINFITGVEKRAPMWMQQCGLEWAYRLLQDPRRLAHRYLVRGPRILPMLAFSDIGLRSGMALTSVRSESWAERNAGAIVGAVGEPEYGV